MSFSVPTSPAMSRSTKAQPVTPQRLPRQQPRSQTLYRSPLTPSTSPYTPPSLRSLDSTGSSTLTTPDNIGINVKKRLNFSVSLEGGRNLTSAKDKSLADIADNWRSRANENGIKVSFSNDNSNYQADSSSDMSISDIANDSSILSTEEALLTAPALTNHRRLHSAPFTGRPRAQSNVSLPTSRMQPFSPITTHSASRLAQTTSPRQPRRDQSFNHSANLMSTPSPNRALARHLKLKGSLTDPAQPRRREAFGAVSISSQNIGHRNSNMNITLESDTSLDLYDIDENDFEYEQDYQGPQLEDSFSRSLHAHNATTIGYPTFSPHQHGHQPIYSNSIITFADPFQPMGAAHGLSSGHVLGSIAESVEQHFHAARQQPIHNQFYQERHQHPHGFYSQSSCPQPQYSQGMPHAYPTPSFVPLPQASMLSFPAAPTQPNLAHERVFAVSSAQPLTPVMRSEHSASSSDCSVCLASRPSSLAILQPCTHPLCSACLTSALNIVGEKDMQCAVCKQSVADFKLVIGSSKGEMDASRASSIKGDLPATKPSLNETTGSDMAGKSFMDPLCSASPGSSTAYDYENSSGSGDLDSAFEFGLDFGELRASTPRMEQQMQDACASATPGQREIVKGENYVVLRIDNVPWDITPTQIIRWLQQPVERVHVLLDGKGKTLSHAYVEVKEPAVAGAVLRGEAQSSGPSGKKERGSVLGRGRRARGVTITRSGQQELMTDLFPHWHGRFEGSRPSLAGLEGDRIIGALEGGLLTENGVSGLLHLIREPDSHFLKVPSLPFHSLISLLAKFPVDVDSRVFWSTGVRDMLFDATYAALQNLLPRVEKAKERSAASGHQEEEFTMELVIGLVQNALDCRAFTAHQIRKLIEFSEAHSLPLPDSDLSLLSESSDFASRSGSSGPRTPASSQEYDNAAFYKQMPNKSQTRSHADSSLQNLAQEFGVDPHVVQALAQRLAGMC